MNKKERILTERLILRTVSPEDTDRLCALLANPKMTETYMVPEYETPRQALSLAEKLIALGDCPDAARFFYGIYLGETLIGWVNVCGAENSAVELGYCIDPAFQNRGYATEAVKAAIGELFSMGVKRVRTGYFEENIPSRRVMEKCGMHPISYTDEVFYRGKTRCCRYFEISC